MKFKALVEFDLLDEKLDVPNTPTMLAMNKMLIVDYKTYVKVYQASGMGPLAAMRVLEVKE